MQFGISSKVKKYFKWHFQLGIDWFSLKYENKNFIYLKIYFKKYISYLFLRLAMLISHLWIIWLIYGTQRQEASSLIPGNTSHAVLVVVPFMIPGTLAKSVILSVSQLCGTQLNWANNTIKCIQSLVIITAATQRKGKLIKNDSLLILFLNENFY